MLFQGRPGRDPWWDDGVGVKRIRSRQRIVARAAFVTALTACASAAAVWLMELAPLAARLAG